MDDKVRRPLQQRSTHSTIDNVAHAAGVSKGTVSNVLNGKATCQRSVEWSDFPN